MWASVRLTFSQLGTSDALLYYLSRAMKQLSSGHVRILRYHIVAQPVAAATVLRAPTGSVGVLQLLPGDPALSILPRAPALIEARFANGDVCLALFAKGQLAGFLWLAFCGYEEDEVRCRYELLDQRLAWDYDVHVEPAFRMGRSLARLWESANGLLLRRGVCWSLSRISAFNPASLAAHARMGAWRMQSVTFACIGPLELAFTTARRLPTISLKHVGRPTLRLRAPANKVE